jgi:hypothetical protein
MKSSTCRAALAALALAIAISVSVASAASAAPEWYSATPEWKQGGASLSEAAATHSKGTVKLRDSSFGVGGDGGVAIECESAGEGSVGSGAVDHQTKLALSKCAVVKEGICKTLEKAEAVDLPWHSELAFVGGSLRDVVTGEGKGNPGFSFTCNST